MDSHIKKPTIIILSIALIFSAFSAVAYAVNEQDMYLRDKGTLSEEMGDPIPWVERIVSAGSQTAEWEGVLSGDINGLYAYQIDIIKCLADAHIKIYFFVDKNGTRIPVADDDIHIDPLTPGYYIPYYKELNGTDLLTADGDKLIFKVELHTGSDEVGIGIDGQYDHSDSRITVKYEGPDACFTVAPELGDFHTDFEVDASCTTDEDYPVEQLQVRWDWDNDGEYDTGLPPNKTASHQFLDSGRKYIKLQVKNPAGITRVESQGSYCRSVLYRRQVYGPWTGCQSVWPGMETTFGIQMRMMTKSIS